MSAANGETLVIVINRLLLRLDARGVSANEIVACIKPLIADSEAKACAELRAVFPKILAALGNGACCAPDVSVEFIKAIPNEVAGVVAHRPRRTRQGRTQGRAGEVRQALVCFGLCRPDFGRHRHLFGCT